MTYTQLFLRFLKQNNVYHLFKNNISHRGNIVLCYNIKSLSTYKPYYFVYDAFKWSNTKEGFDFWSDINTKWRDILRNKLSLYTSLKIIGNDKVISSNEFINLINKK